MIRQVGDFVQKDFQTTNPYVGVNLIRKNLISCGAIVVLDEDSNEYLGVLTPFDIVQRRYNLVADCLIEKPMLGYEFNIKDALETMYQQNEEVLPLEKNGQFEGLVFKKDLVSYLASQNIKQREQIQSDDQEIKRSQRILNAIYNSTHSIRFLISPDYSILFYNKAANKLAFSLLRKKMKIGDNFTLYYPQLLYQKLDFKSDFEKALKGEQIVRENEVVHLDESRWIKTEYYPVYTHEKLIGVSISSHDITERKRNEVFLEQQSKALKDIIFFQSHEVRRPVANILGIIQLIDKTQLTLNNREAIELLAKATTEFDNIIRQIVETAHFWSEIEQQRIK
jgi:PAS domain S-box-containing protein